MSGVSAALNCDLSADRHVGIFLAKCNGTGRWRFLQMALGYFRVDTTGSFDG